MVQEFVVTNRDHTQGVEITSDNDLCTTARLRDGNGNPILAATPLPVSSNFRPGKWVSLHGHYLENHEMNVDGSVTPVEFKIEPPAGKKYYITRLIVSMENTSINFLKFGGISGGLTNGVEIVVKEGGEVERPILEHPWKLNADIKKHMYDTNIESAAHDILTGRMTFTKAGTTFELSASRGDYITTRVNDNLTSLSAYTHMWQGYEVDE